MEETLEYWQKCIAEFETALEAEQSAEEVNGDMIKLLKEEIEYCQSEIDAL